MGYTKPVVLMNDDLGEGVYAASGSTSETVDYSLRVNSEGNQYYNWNGYNITFTNNTGKTLSTFSVRLTSNKNISSVRVDNGLVTGRIATPTTLELTYKATEDWAKLAPGSKFDLSFAVQGDVPFTLH